MQGERLDIRIQVNRLTPEVTVAVEQEPPQIFFRINRGGTYHMPYDGPYTVDPLFTEQVLETNGKRMTDDVTVHEIRVFEASNPQGGKTVTIGVIGE